MTKYRLTIWNDSGDCFGAGFFDSYAEAAVRAEYRRENGWYTRIERVRVPIL